VAAAMWREKPGSSNSSSMYVAICARSA
jgi:hypothetical protein